MEEQPSEAAAASSKKRKLPEESVDSAKRAKRATQKFFDEFITDEVRKKRKQNGRVPEGWIDNLLAAVKEHPLTIPTKQSIHNRGRTPPN